MSEFRPSTPASYLSLAARLALRARGYAEPNPIVGAVIVKEDRIIGCGHHKKFGGLHAEAEALKDCRERGEDPRGATMYVTLEPCNHYGKQPPCSKAVIEAGISRVVCARRDPNPVSTGGAAALERAGIPIEFTDVSPLATNISEPFIKLVTTGLPWVIAKWAQTSDGRLVTRPDEQRWISNAYSRRRVHIARARVDAVLTGIGTVLADDPLLTARGVRVRRLARRVVLDSQLRIPISSALVKTAPHFPLLICTLATTSRARASSVSALRSAGADVREFEGPSGVVPIAAVLRHLGQDGAANVLVEGGPRLLENILSEGLADALLIHVAPPLSSAIPTFPGYRRWRTRGVAGDLEHCYLRS